MAQNIHNHRRFNPLFHFFLIPVTLTAFIISLFNAKETPDYVHASISVIFFLILITAFVARVFALKAQDRAIRAEMALGYYILAGRAIPKELRIGQIIALRFASDQEVVALTTKAAAEQLSPAQIKREIATWNEDHHRV